MQFIHFPKMCEPVRQMHYHLSLSIDDKVEVISNIPERFFVSLFVCIQKEEYLFYLDDLMQQAIDLEKYELCLFIQIVQNTFMDVIGISNTIWDRYIHTTYYVRDLNLRISAGQVNKEMDAFVAERGYKSWALFTASNSFLPSLDDVEEQRKSINWSNMKFITGKEYKFNFISLDYHENNKWDWKLLLFDLEALEAQEIAQFLHQKAVLTGKIGEKVRLFPFQYKKDETGYIEYIYPNHNSKSKKIN